MTVPFVDLQRLHARSRDDLLAAFARVLDSGGFVQGAEVAALESEFGAQYGANHALAVNNGTSALHLALLACGVMPGDEVITVANTFIATAEAILMAGAIPVFADIEQGGFNMDPADFERRITPRTKAVIPVHLYGQIADMARILPIARRRGLKVIEDACQAHGAVRDGVRAGLFGDAGCLSFYPTKNVGTVGEGGMVLTQDPEIAERVRMLRDHGQSERHHHVLAGFNYRMPELQAAALRVLLPHLDRWNSGRIAAAKQYENELAGCEVARPEIDFAGSHVYHLFVIRSAQRNLLRAHLDEHGIATAIHYPTPIHLQIAFKEFGEGPGSLPRTEAAVTEILSLPMHPLITRDEITAVADGMRSFPTKSHASQRVLQETHS